MIHTKPDPIELVEKRNDLEKVRLAKEDELVKHGLLVHRTTKQTRKSMAKTTNMKQSLFNEVLQSDNMKEHDFFENRKKNYFDVSHNCSMCDHTYSSDSLLEDHIRYMHTMQLRTDLVNDLKYECPICSKTFPKKSYRIKRVSKSKYFQYFNIFIFSISLIVL